MKKHDSTSVRRYLTRAFAKSSGISVKQYTLEDLDAASGGSRAQKPSSIPRPPSGPIAVTIRDSQNSRNQSSEHKPDNVDSTSANARRQPVSRSTDNRYPIQVVEGESLLGQSRLSAEPRSTNQYDRLSDWLGELRPVSPQDFRSSAVSGPYQQHLEMAHLTSSSSLNTSESGTTQEITQTDTSTAKKSKKGITYLENLEFRGVSRSPSDDEKIRELGFDKIAHNLPDRIEFQHLASLVNLLETYHKKLKKAIRDQAQENGFYDYDALRQDICEWRPVSGEHRRFAPMPMLYFDWDRKHCSRAGSNEADFHRTLMASIIDRYDFRNIFTFTCEEQWAVDDEFLLPARGKINKMAQPKPDLAFSFDRMSITDLRTPYFPQELGSCLHPNRKNDERWFPFFFMEAKKGDDPLRTAFQKNLTSASQALFNIFQWMRLCPELEQQFFTDVRVFTIDINSKDVLLRIHRAEKGSGLLLQYEHAEVTEIRSYNRIQICHIVKTVLLDYASATLLPILKNTFQKVVEMSISTSTKKKRKDHIDNLNVEASRRGNSSQDTVIPPQPRHTDISFEAGGLTISDAENAPKRTKVRRRANATGE